MSVTYTPKDLFAGHFPVATDIGTLAAGAGNLTRGSVLGRVNLGDSSVAAGAGKTGNCTSTKDATTPILASAMVGDYVITCTTAHNDTGPVAAIFTVVAPDGTTLGTHTEGGTAFATQIKFAIAAGSADFVLGDKFVFTIAEGSGELKLITSAATDGSQNAYAILADDYDASSAAKSVAVYMTGEFNADALTVGSGISLPIIRHALATRNIYVRNLI